MLLLLIVVYVDAVPPVAFAGYGLRLFTIYARLRLPRLLHLRCYVPRLLHVCLLIPPPAPLLVVAFTDCTHTFTRTLPRLRLTRSRFELIAFVTHVDCVVTGLRYVYVCCCGCWLFVHTLRYVVCLHVALRTVDFTAIARLRYVDFADLHVLRLRLIVARYVRLLITLRL